MLGTFLDVKKWFDCMDHNILLNKLDKYGLNSVANNHIFLSNLFQWVLNNDTLSESITSKFGVLQKKSWVHYFLIFILMI